MFWAILVKVTILKSGYVLCINGKQRLGIYQNKSPQWKVKVANLPNKDNLKN